MQLCAGCRTQLANRPIPLWIKISAVVVGGVFIYALSRLPAEIPGEIAFEKGMKAEKAANYAAAEEDYKTAVKAFPDSNLVVAHLGIAEYRNHDILAAAITLDSLHDREVSQELATEVNGVIDDIKRDTQ